MDEDKRKRLEEAGFRVGGIQEFLGLTDEEMAYIHLRSSVSDAVRARLRSSALSRYALAKRLEVTRSQVNSLAAGDPSVSLDLLVRALLATGATVLDIAEAIAPERVRAA
jgi:predicted XRE-type DNA-binding protein